MNVTDRSADTQFEDKTIERVEVVGEDKAYAAVTADGWTLSVALNGNPAPKVGDVALYYGRGIGYPVRGFVVGETVYYYETEEQHEARFRRERQEEAERRIAAFDAGRAAYYAEVNALPAPFRRRIERFLRVRAGWGPEFGGYELFVCKEAVKIAALGTVDAVAVYHAAPCDEQKTLVHAVAYDEHSNNTFGAACLLARVYIETPEHLTHVHGALCPLVGCENYGCFAATRETTEGRGS